MSNLYLVHGPPGTGKTTWLARQAQRAAQEHGPSSVVIASLTKTAAHEIAGRDTGVPDQLVGTLHAHAARALDHPDLAETPEAIREFGAHHPALRRGGGSADMLEDAPDAGEGQTIGDQLHAAVMNHRARLTPPEQWTDSERDYHQLWEDYKRQTSRLDFTDLIETCIHEVPVHPAAPQAVLLDEAQDLSRLELALATRWAQGAATAVVVGDTDQALYAWRGSDPDALLRLPAAGSRVLEQSHRVPHAVHAAASAWIEQVEHRPDVTYHPRTGDPGTVDVSPLSLRSVDELAASIGVRETTMILASCTYMLQGLVAALKQAGVPFHNPYRPKAGAWNPLRGAGRLLAYLRPQEDTWGDRARAWTWSDLRDWVEPLQARTALARGAKAAIDEHCRPDRFGITHEDEDVPLETLCTLLDDPGTLTHPAFRLDTAWWERNLRSKRAAQMTYPLQVLRASGGQALREDPKVVVGTIHSVKGGEADHVILAPDLSKAGYYQAWLPGGPARDGIIRMAYVGLTRARHHVTVLQPSGPEHLPVHDLVGETGAIAA